VALVLAIIVFWRNNARLQIQSLWPPAATTGTGNFTQQSRTSRVCLCGCRRIRWVVLPGVERGWRSFPPRVLLIVVRIWCDFLSIHLNPAKFHLKKKSLCRHRGVAMFCFKTCSRQSGARLTSRLLLHSWEEAVRRTQRGWTSPEMTISSHTCLLPPAIIASQRSVQKCWTILERQMMTTFLSLPD